MTTEAKTTNETFSANDYKDNAQPMPADNENASADTPADNGSNANGDVAQIMQQVMTRGSNRELCLIADNPDGSAEVLLVRGDSGDAECYWFTVNGNVMSPLLKSIIFQALKLNDEKVATPRGFYSYASCACGMAACFQANIPGVRLREAFFATLDYALYAFVAGTRGWSAHDVTFIKQNRNLAYKYRKACQALADEANGIDKGGNKGNGKGARSGRSGNDNTDMLDDVFGAIAGGDDEFELI